MKELINDNVSHDGKIINHKIFESVSQLHKHQSSFLSDVTLACNDGDVKTYKILLATISPMLSDIFDNKSPDTIILSDFSRADIFQFLSSCLDGQSLQNMDIIKALAIDTRHLSNQQNYDEFTKSESNDDYCEKEVIDDKTLEMIIDNDGSMVTDTDDGQHVEKNILSEMVNQGLESGHKKDLTDDYNDLIEEVNETDDAEGKGEKKGSYALKYFISLDQNTKQCQICNKVYSYNPKKKTDKTSPHPSDKLRGHIFRTHGISQSLKSYTKVILRHKKSAVWNYFVKIGDSFVRCKVCDGTYRYNSGAGGALRRHLVHAHKMKSEDLSRPGTIEILDCFDADENGYMCIYCKRCIGHCDNQQLLKHITKYHTEDFVISFE